MKESVFDKILRQMRLRQIVPHLREFDNPRVLDVGCGWEARLLRQIEPFIVKGVGIDFKAPEIETEKLSVFSYVFEVKQGANSHEANSSLGNHCIDLANFECSQTYSLASRTKFAKNSTSKTASRRLDKRSEVPNTRILGESMGDSAKDSGDSAESSRHCEHSQNVKQSIKTAESQKDSNDSAESTKDFNIIDCHEAKAFRNDDSGAVSSNSITSRNDASLSSLRGQRPKQSINASNLAESRRSERVKSAESHIESAKDSINSSDFVDSSDSKTTIDSHDSATPNLAMTKNDAFKASRNDASAVDSHDFIPQNLALPSNKVANAIIGIGGGI